MIDSLYMTDAYREKLAEQCIEATEDNIIITHGTDTMAAMAAYLDKSVKEKTIVHLAISLKS